MQGRGSGVHQEEVGASAAQPGHDLLSLERQLPAREVRQRERGHRRVCIAGLCSGHHPHTRREGLPGACHTVGIANACATQQYSDTNHSPKTEGAHQLLHPSEMLVAHRRFPVGALNPSTRQTRCRHRARLAPHSRRRGPPWRAVADRAAPRRQLPVRGERQPRPSPLRSGFAGAPRGHASGGVVHGPRC